MQLLCRLMRWEKEGPLGAQCQLASVSSGAQLAAGVQFRCKDKATNSRELQSSACDPNQIPEVGEFCQPVLHKGYNAGRSSFCVSKGTAKHA